MAGLASLLPLMVGLITLPTSSATVQILPEACRDLQNCASYRFMDEDQWKVITDKCCSQHPGTTFHCQDLDGHAVSACLVPKTCEPGQAPRLSTADGKMAVECVKCDKDLFQPTSMVSYKHNRPTCSEPKQICVNDMTLVTEGDSAQDRRCRCLWEKGWGPVRTSHSKCKDFVSSDQCYCEEQDCPQGMQLGQDYECIPETTMAPETTEAPRSHEWIPPDRPFPGGLERKQNGLARTIYLYMLSAVVGFVLIFVIWFNINIIREHRRRNR